MVEIGKKIRELGKSKNMSQKELSERLNVTPQTISKWELDKSSPDLDSLIKLSKFFQISVDELLGFSKATLFEKLFSKKSERNGIQRRKGGQKAMAKDGEIPKAIKVENAASILKIEFNTGDIKYLKSHDNENTVDAYSLKNGTGKRALLHAYARYNWIGNEVKIETDGTVILNERDRYTPEELWNNSRSHVTEL